MCRLHTLRENKRVQTSHFSSGREYLSSRSNPYIFRFRRICMGIAIFFPLSNGDKSFPRSPQSSSDSDGGEGTGEISLSSPFTFFRRRKPSTESLFIKLGGGGGDVHFVGSGEMRRWGNIARASGGIPGERRSLCFVHELHIRSGKLQR